MNSLNIKITLQLVKAAKEGDNEALEELCSHYMARIHRLARIRLGSHLRQCLDTADISQEVIIRVLKGLDRFEFNETSSFLNWVSRLVENTIRDQADYYCASKRDIRKQDGLPFKSTEQDHLLDQAAISPRITSQLELKDDIVRLERALDELDVDQREIIVLRNYAEMPFKDIAMELGCSVDAARMKFVRALDKLTRLMTQ